MKGYGMKALSLGLLGICTAALCGSCCGNYEEIKLKVGASKTIVLPANPSTGYSWQVRELVAQDRKVVDVEGPEYKSSEHEHGRLMVGSGGHEHWTFRGVQKGVVRLLFEYLRKWDPESVVKAGSFSPREYRITVVE
jgi:inhibitor of cysteine peptidase